MKMLFDAEDELHTGATFSPCRRYRYVLWRRWDDGKPPCVFIGLNPSTADETKDDPTIRRCIRFSRDWGYGGYLMLNAYGFRATDPRHMKAAAEPNGPGNDAAIDLVVKSTVRAGGLVVAAWGVHCEPGRANRVCELAGVPLYCLGLTKARCPKHPLYIRADTKPSLYWSPEAG